MRIIKRYENRCLYDNELSANITVQDLKKYILDGVQFKVVNAKTEEDLTRQYLIQIILELEGMGSPLFTQQYLEQIIRLCATPEHHMFQQYLEQSMSFMSQMWANTRK